jgi:hypothetical protein
MELLRANQIRLTVISAAGATHRLQQYANTYDYWRYFHEKGHGNFNSEFCENLAEVLHQMAQVELQRLLARAREPEISET